MEIIGRKRYSQNRTLANQSNYYAIENLALNPFPPQHRKLKIAEALYRIRAGNYRVIYQVDLVEKTVTIIYIRHRKIAYRNL